MADHGDAGIPRTHLNDMVRKKSLMDRTVPLPQNKPRLAQTLFRVSAKFFKRIPDQHFIQAKSETVGGVASKMLIGKEEDLVGSFKSPAHNGGRVRRRAHSAAMTAAKCFDSRRRVHVRDRNDPFAGNPNEIIPAGFNLIQLRHVRHRATGAHIGKDDLLMLTAENVGAFRHEVHAAKYDVIRSLASRSPLSKLEGIAPYVRELDHFIALVVVSENHQPRSEVVLQDADASVRFRVAQVRKALR